MTQHGGKRGGSGRKPGAVSKAKRDLAEMAKDHAEMALRTLADIAKSGTTESARVSAANALLDRAYGKPSQALDHSSSDGTMTPQPSHIIIEAATDDDSPDQAAP